MSIKYTKNLERSFMGDEPKSNEDVSTPVKLSLALNWYNYAYDHKDAKKFFVEEFPDNEYAKDVKDTLFPTTLGFYAKMKSNGITNLNWNSEFIKNSLESLKHLSLRNDDETQNISYIISQKRFIPESNNVINTLEDMIYEKKSTAEEIEKYLLSLSLNTADYQRISAAFIGCLNEFNELIEKKTPDLVEAYSSWTKSRIRNRHNCYKTIENICKFKSNENKIIKQTRKPRKKKLQNILKVFVYKKSDDVTKLTSIEGSRILNAKSLWTYNAKNRMLSHYISENGISVKGKTLINISDSKTKKIRKPEEFMQIFKSTTSARKLKLFNEIKAVASKARDRIDLETILVSAD